MDSTPSPQSYLNTIPSSQSYKPYNKYNKYNKVTPTNKPYNKYNKVTPSPSNKPYKKYNKVTPSSSSSSSYKKQTPTNEPWPIIRPTKSNTLHSSSYQRYSPFINNNNNKPIITNPFGPSNKHKPSPATDYNAPPKSNKYNASFATTRTNHKDYGMFKLYKKYFQFETI